MPKREYSERYILSTPKAKREFEGRDYCPECGAPATDGRGNEAGAQFLADIQHWEARLCLLECQCGTRYHCYG